MGPKSGSGPRRTGHPSGGGKSGARPTGPRPTDTCREEVPAAPAAGRVRTRPRLAFERAAARDGKAISAPEIESGAPAGGRALAFPPSGI